MKCVAIFLAVCVAGSLGGVINTLGAANVGVAKGGVVAVGGKGLGFGTLGTVGAVGAIGANGLGKSARKAGDLTRDWRQADQGVANWANSDVKKGALDNNWTGRHSAEASDETSASQDWNQESAAHKNAADASNRAAAKNAHAAAARSGFQDWDASHSADKNSNWANNQGWRKGNRRHESIGYGFDKKYARNANEDGGYNAGSSLDDHSLDDIATRQVRYNLDRGDHSANAAHANRQNADRASGFGNQAWRSAAAADKFGRDANQAGAANANDQDWAEKRDAAVSKDRYQDDRNSRALDAAGDVASRDSNAGRNTVGFGAVNDNLGRGVVALNGPYNFGVAGKGLGVGKVNTAAIGKGVGLNGVVLGKGVAGAVPVAAVPVAVVPAHGGAVVKAKGGADSSSLWDNAQRNKAAHALGAATADTAKDSALANQWLASRVKGFNKDQAASLHDIGYGADRAQQAGSANTANQAWANADAAKAAAQGSHDLDEHATHSSNNKWRQSDRDHKRKEWKKFFNNAGKGGQNWERLKYNRDQQDDAAQADFEKRYDDQSSWQDAHRSDDAARAAHTAQNARAADAANRQWLSDATSDASGADSSEKEAEADASAAQWGNDNDKRKVLLDQSRRDHRNQDKRQSDRNTYKAGFDARAAGAGNAYDTGRVNYGYGYGYPSSGYKSYGSPSYGSYSYGYPAAYNGYGSAYPSKGYGSYY